MVKFQILFIQLETIIQNEKFNLSFFFFFNLIYYLDKRTHLKLLKSMSSRVLLLIMVLTVSGLVSAVPSQRFGGDTVTPDIVTQTTETPMWSTPGLYRICEWKIHFLNENEFGFSEIDKFEKKCHLERKNIFRILYRFG